MLMIDGHQDLAWNMITFDRDYSLAAAETRRRERGTQTPARNGDTLLGWPDFQRGEVTIIFASLFAKPIQWKGGDWDTQCYGDVHQANALYRTQVDAYARLVDIHPDKFQLVPDQSNLRAVLEAWEKEADDTEKPVGLVLAMENGEGVRNPSELEMWWALGVRVLGPAWAGTRYCGGTHEPGPLTKEGYALLDAMGDLGYILDLSHMDEKAVLQALDHYPGMVVATHANAAQLLKDPGNRFLSDRVIQGILERDGVIGVIPANPFLVADWRPYWSREAVALGHVVAQIDYICQMVGNADHVALGSAYDGGFGVSSAPAGIDTIADLQKLAPLLLERGYAEADVAAIFHGNWLEKLETSLPEVI